MIPYATATATSPIRHIAPALNRYGLAITTTRWAISKRRQTAIRAGADAWVQVGYCKVKQGKNEEAIRAYQHALELKPESAEIHNKLGDAYYYAGLMSDAIASYSRAISLRPAFADAHYNLAVAYFETGTSGCALNEARILRQLDGKLYERLITRSGWSNTVASKQ